MKLFNLKTLIFFLLALVSGQSLAGFACTPTIERVLIYASGAVNIRHSEAPDYTVICNMKEERQGVSIATCAMWTSLLLDIEKSGEKARFYYATQEVNSCAELPIYGNAPAPTYVGSF